MSDSSFSKYVKMFIFFVIFSTTSFSFFSCAGPIKVTQMEKGLYEPPQHPFPDDSPVIFVWSRVVDMQLPYGEMDLSTLVESKLVSFTPERYVGSAVYQLERSQRMINIAINVALNNGDFYFNSPQNYFRMWGMTIKNKPFKIDYTYGSAVDWINVYLTPLVMEEEVQVE